MAHTTDPGLVAQLPDEMLKFVLDSGAHTLHGSRVGQLLARGRSSIPTPHFAAATSRGVIPHIAPDVLEKRTNIAAIYLGLEDSHSSYVVIEKSTNNPPVFAVPPTSESSPLRNFTALPERCVSILGPRRVPRMLCPSQSTNDSIPVCTSVGFRKLGLQEYNDATKRLAPDIISSLADIADADHVSIKRTEKMADRTHGWLRDTLEGTTPASAIFATTLPLDNVQQRLYLSDIAEDYLPSISGLILHDPQTAAVIPATIQTLPRVCISDPPTPHALIASISPGVDLITVPFVTRITEQGIAFDFTFPPPDSSDIQLPLGTDMWLPSHAADLSPLSPTCTCYTCTRHHRAYLHHLLQAKEMLAWTLLQIHNFHVLDCFFAGVRQSIAAGTFEADAKRFGNTYEADFMVGEGKERGPRLRGYQMKSVGRGEDRKREKVWGRFEDSEDVSGAQSPSVAGVEDDMARKVVEAMESGAVGGTEQLGEGRQ